MKACVTYQHVMIPMLYIYSMLCVVQAKDVPNCSYYYYYYYYCRFIDALCVREAIPHESACVLTETVSDLNKYWKPYIYNYYAGTSLRLGEPQFKVGPKPPSRMHVVRVTLRIRSGFLLARSNESDWFALNSCLTGFQEIVRSQWPARRHYLLYDAGI